MILLGKDESKHVLNPTEIKIRWKLLDAYNNDLDYEIFEYRFIFGRKGICKNPKFEIQIPSEWNYFPTEVLQYEPFSI